MSTFIDPPTAVVTGVSSGIGHAIAKALIDSGWRVFGSVRTEPAGRDLAAAWGERFTPLIFDVTDEAAIRSAADQVKSALQGRNLTGLVNNAGVAVYGPLRYLSIKDLRHQFEVNVYGVLTVTQAFLPLLGADSLFRGKPGRIVNISSTGGKLPAPFMAPYAMSKHALEAFSDSLRGELLVHGIDVITVGPGMVRTPMFDKADALDTAAIDETEYGPVVANLKALARETDKVALAPEAVAVLVRRILMARRPRTRYTIARYKLFMWTLPRLLPPRLMDRLVARRFGLPILNNRR